MASVGDFEQADSKTVIPKIKSRISLLLLLLALLRPLEVHLNWLPALRALARLGSLHWLRLGERHVEFVCLVFSMPALRTFNSHVHDYRNPIA
jgi:hypothetical protein